MELADTTELIEQEDSDFIRAMAFKKEDKEEKDEDEDHPVDN